MLFKCHPVLLFCCLDQVHECSRLSISTTHENTGVVIKWYTFRAHPQFDSTLANFEALLAHFECQEEEIVAL